MRHGLLVGGRSSRNRVLEVSILQYPASWVISPLPGATKTKREVIT